MWLILTVAAAIVTSVLWYIGRRTDKYQVGFLSLVYWGASLMWLVDHVIAHAQNGGPFFDMSAGATALGFCVLALGALIWVVRLLFSSLKRRGQAFRVR